MARELDPLFETDSSQASAVSECFRMTPHLLPQASAFDGLLKRMAKCTSLEE